MYTNRNVEKLYIFICRSSWAFVTLLYFSVYVVYLIYILPCLLIYFIYKLHYIKIIVSWFWRCICLGITRGAFREEFHEMQLFHFVKKKIAYTTTTKKAKQELLFASILPYIPLGDLSLRIPFSDCSSTHTSRSISSKVVPSGSDDDENILILRDEIEQWMAQPEQDMNNLPVHLKQVRFHYYRLNNFE